MGESKTESFINYLGSVLQNSMVTGIPQIATAGSVPLKILRALVFIFCLTGFIYQSMEFMNMYWEYETILDIQVEHQKIAEMPSITVCTNNGLNTTKMCADPKFRSQCYPLTLFFDENPCSSRSHFCENGLLFNTTVPLESVVDDISHSEYEIYQPYLTTITDLIWVCHLESDGVAVRQEFRCIPNYRNIRCPKEDYDLLRACYTIYTLLDRPEAEEQQVSTEESLIFMFDAGSLLYNIKVPSPQIQMSIHNSKNILNPYVYGYQLQKGKINMFRLTKTVKHLLPPPYKTNCKDYITEWKNRGGKGRTTEKECIQECQKNSSMETHGCITPQLLAPSNEKICNADLVHEGVLLKSQECAAKNCKPACYEVSYEVEKEVTNYDFIADCSSLYWKLFCTIARVIIKFDGMQTTTYTYRPKFENIETFSYVGGYVGMWLGISLIAVFDFLETLLVILRYPIRQIIQKRTMKQRVRQIHRNV